MVRKKILPSTLAAFYFVSNCVLLHAAESNIWKERHKAFEVASLPPSFPLPSSRNVPMREPVSFPSALSKRIENQIPKNQKSIYFPIIKTLSSPFGTIRKVSTPHQSEKIVIHIQDVHLNSEAQSNIGKTVESLIGDKRIGLMALEGAFAPINLDKVRRFEDHRAVEVVADYLLRENRISGAVHGAFVFPSEIPQIVGVDDQVHYEANVQAYKDSVLQQTKTREKLKDMATSVEAQLRAASANNPALQSFHSHIQDFRQEKISLGEFVSLLANKQTDVSPTVEVFLEAYKLEKSLNFAQVEAERNRLLEELLKKLTPAQSSEIMQNGAAFRVGHLSPADFYQYIRNLCDQKGISLSHYKAMDSYLQYVLLSDGIDMDALFPTISKMEQDTYAALIKTDEQKRLVGESKRIHLTGKLVDFSLTPEEWGEYKSVRSAQCVVRRKDTTDYELRTTDLKSFEDFYREAEKRNQAITTNLLKAMETNKTNVALLVTGGFHTPGIDRLLKQQGVASISFVPKISKIDESPDASTKGGYLTVFAREKTPLDKLFAGEKLYLAQFPSVKNLDAVENLEQIASQNAKTNQIEIKRDNVIVKFAKDHSIELVTVSLGVTGLLALAKAKDELLKILADAKTTCASIIIKLESQTDPRYRSAGFTTIQLSIALALFVVGSILVASLTHNIYIGSDRTIPGFILGIYLLAIQGMIYYGLNEKMQESAARQKRFWKQVVIISIFLTISALVIFGLIDSIKGSRKPESVTPKTSQQNYLFFGIWKRKKKTFQEVKDGSDLWLTDAQKRMAAQLNSHTPKRSIAYLPGALNFPSKVVKILLLAATSVAVMAGNKGSSQLITQAIPAWVLWVVAIFLMVLVRDYVAAHHKVIFADQHVSLNDHVHFSKSEQSSEGTEPSERNPIKQLMDQNTLIRLYTEVKQLIVFLTMFESLFDYYKNDAKTEDRKSFFSGMVERIEMNRKLLIEHINSLSDGIRKDLKAIEDKIFEADSSNYLQMLKTIESPLLKLSGHPDRYGSSKRNIDAHEEEKFFSKLENFFSGFSKNLDNHFDSTNAPSFEATLTRICKTDSTEVAKSRFKIVSEISAEILEQGLPPLLVGIPFQKLGTINGAIAHDNKFRTVDDVRLYIVSRHQNPKLLSHPISTLDLLGSYLLWLKAQIPKQKSAGPAMRWKRTELTSTEHDVVDEAISLAFDNNDQLVLGRELTKDERQMIDPSNTLKGIKILFLPRLMNRIIKICAEKGIEVPFDLLTHPGRHRKQIYLDPSWFDQLSVQSLKFKKGWARHEMKHFEFPDLEEEEIEKLAPKPVPDVPTETETIFSKLTDLLNSPKGDIDRLSPSTEKTIGDVVNRYQRTYSPTFAAERFANAYVALRAVIDLRLPSEIASTPAIELGSNNAEINRLAQSLKTMENVRKFLMSINEGENEIEISENSAVNLLGTYIIWLNKQKPHSKKSSKSAVSKKSRAEKSIERINWHFLDFILTKLLNLKNLYSHAESNTRYLAIQAERRSMADAVQYLSKDWQNEVNPVLEPIVKGDQSNIPAILPETIAHIKAFQSRLEDKSFDPSKVRTPATVLLLAGLLSLGHQQTAWIIPVIIIASLFIFLAWAYGQPALQLAKGGFHPIDPWVHFSMNESNDPTQRKAIGEMKSALHKSEQEKYLRHLNELQTMLENAIKLVGTSPEVISFLRKIIREMTNIFPDSIYNHFLPFIREMRQIQNSAIPDFVSNKFIPQIEIIRQQLVTPTSHPKQKQISLQDPWDEHSVSGSPELRFGYTTLGDFIMACALLNKVRQIEFFPVGSTYAGYGSLEWDLSSIKNFAREKGILNEQPGGSVYLKMTAGKEKDFRQNLYEVIIAISKLENSNEHTSFHISRKGDTLVLMPVQLGRIKPFDIPKGKGHDSQLVRDVFSQYPDLLEVNSNQALGMVVKDYEIGDGLMPVDVKPAPGIETRDYVFKMVQATFILTPALWLITQSFDTGPPLIAMSFFFIGTWIIFLSDHWPKVVTPVNPNWKKANELLGEIELFIFKNNSNVRTDIFKPIYSSLIDFQNRTTSRRDTLKRSEKIFSEYQPIKKILAGLTQNNTNEHLVELENEFLNEIAPYRVKKTSIDDLVNLSFISALYISLAPGIILSLFPLLPLVMKMPVISETHFIIKAGFIVIYLAFLTAMPLAVSALTHKIMNDITNAGEPLGVKTKAQRIRWKKKTHSLNYGYGLVAREIMAEVLHHQAAIVEFDSKGSHFNPDERDIKLDYSTVAQTAVQYGIFYRQTNGELSLIRKEGKEEQFLQGLIDAMYSYSRLENLNANTQFLMRFEKSTIYLKPVHVGYQTDAPLISISAVRADSENVHNELSKYPALSKYLFNPKNLGNNSSALGMIVGKKYEIGDGVSPNFARTAPLRETRRFGIGMLASTIFIMILSQNYFPAHFVLASLIGTLLVCVTGYLEFDYRHSKKAVVKVQPNFSDALHLNRTLEHALQNYDQQIKDAFSFINVRINKLLLQNDLVWGSIKESTLLAETQYILDKIQDANGLITLDEQSYSNLKINPFSVQSGKIQKLIKDLIRAVSPYKVDKQKALGRKSIKDFSRKWVLAPSLSLLALPIAWKLLISLEPLFRDGFHFTNNYTAILGLVILTITVAIPWIASIIAYDHHVSFNKSRKVGESLAMEINSSGDTGHHESEVRTHEFSVGYENLAKDILAHALAHNTRLIQIESLGQDRNSKTIQLNYESLIDFAYEKGIFREWTEEGDLVLAIHPKQEDQFLNGLSFLTQQFWWLENVDGKTYFEISLKNKKLYMTPKGLGESREFKKPAPNRTINDSRFIKNQFNQYPNLVPFINNGNPSATNQFFGNRAGYTQYKLMGLLAAALVIPISIPVFVIAALTLMAWPTKQDIKTNPSSTIGSILGSVEPLGVGDHYVMFYPKTNSMTESVTQIISVMKALRVGGALTQNTVIVQSGAEKNINIALQTLKLLGLAPEKPVQVDVNDSFFDNGPLEETDLDSNPFTQGATLVAGPESMRPVSPFTRYKFIDITAFAPVGEVSIGQSLKAAWLALVGA